jgi:hypothetical protein
MLCIPKSVVVESFTKTKQVLPNRQHLFVLVKDSTTTDS